VPAGPRGLIRRHHGIGTRPAIAVTPAAADDTFEPAFNSEGEGKRPQDVRFVAATLSGGVLPVSPVVIPKVLMSTPTFRSDESPGSDRPDPPVQLAIDIRAVGDQTVLTVGGEVDIVTVESFENALRDAQRSPRVVVDLSEVTFMDSAGINALVGAYHRVGPDCELRLVGLRPNVRRVFEITGLLELFKVGPSDHPPAPVDS
jgi:anti-anti-sigma factor